MTHRSNLISIVVNKNYYMYCHIHRAYDFDNVASWCKDNKLSIDIKKTKAMGIGIRW